MQQGDSWESGTSAGSAALDSADVGDLSEYRRVSKFAVLAVAAGAASILAWAHVLLWFVPVVAILFALLAFREISHEESALSGRAAAVLGLTLALVFGIGAVTRFVTERQVVTTQAKQFAERFLEMTLNGETEHASQLEQPFDFRVTPGLSLRTYYSGNPDAMAAVEAFESEDFTKRTVKAGPDAKVKFLGLEEFEKFNHNHSLVLRYQIDGGEPFDVVLVVSRSKNPETSLFTHWQIRGHELKEVGSP